MKPRISVYKAVALGLAAIAVLLACCSESDARCRLFGRPRAQRCCPQASCDVRTTSRCAIYYSGQLGNVYMHYGAYPSGTCSTNTGPVYLTQAYCTAMACPCSYDSTRCIDTARFKLTDRVADGIKKDSKPNADPGSVHNLKDKILNEGFGRCELVKPNGDHIRWVDLRFVEITSPDGPYYLGYEIGIVQMDISVKIKLKPNSKALSVVELDPPGAIGKKTFDLLLVNPDL